MILLLVFSVTLLIAVLISGLARRSIVSIAALFLVAGFLSGLGVFGNLSLTGSLSIAARVWEVALFSVLFTDGMRTGGVREIARGWRLPGRALLIGMPLTIAGIAVLARYLVHIGWIESFLVAAALSPTDPIFISAIFRFEAVPRRLKQLLNIEAGLNDGIALPVVVLLIAELNHKGPGMGRVAADLVFGAIIGVVIPWLGIRLESSRAFGAAGIYEPLNAFSLGLLVLAICYMSGANLFLAAFAAGIAVVSISQPVRQSFERFGEFVTELLKLAALLLFGAVIAPRFLIRLSAGEYAFIVLSVFAVRPPVFWISYLRSGLSWREVLVAGWFGPKGFGSVVYGLLIFEAGLQHLADLVGFAAALSIIVFSSTDIFVGRWFEKHGVPAEPAGSGARPIG